MTKKTPDKKEVGSAFDLLVKSYEIVKKNWLAFLAVNILAVLSIFSSFKSQSPKQKPENMNFEELVKSISGLDIGTFVGFAVVLIVLLIAVAIYLFAMMTILEVESTAGKKPSLGHLFEKAKKYWLPLLGVMVISGIIVVAGFLLLIIPGIIALTRLIMAPYFMVDKDMGVMEAIRASNEMGRKHFWQVLSAIGVMVLVAVATAILDAIPGIGAVIGVLIAIAFSLVIPLRYQQLKKIS